MGSYVIDKGRVGTAHSATGVQPQEFGPCLFPFTGIAALAAVRAGSVMPALAFKLALHLAGTKDAMRHDSTA